MTASISQLGDVSTKTKTATQAVLNATSAAGYNLSQVWGVGGGDHADGYASDFMVFGDRSAGDWIADYIWEHRQRLGVRWVIWRQRIRSTTPGKSGQWENMPDRGDTTQNHMDHVHVKWNTNAVAGLTVPAPQGPAQSGGQSGPIHVPTGPKLAPNQKATGISVRVSNLQRGVGSENEADDNDIAQYNQRVWEVQGADYRKAHQEAWDAESSQVYGWQTAQVTYDLYRYLKGKYPQDARWSELPTHSKGDPAMPGEELLKYLGFGIVQ